MGGDGLTPRPTLVRYGRWLWKVISGKSAVGTLSSDQPGHTVRSWLRKLFDHGPFTVVFNLAGQPALSLPLGHSESGLPIGCRSSPPYGREDLLLRIGAQLEQVMPWKDRAPHFSH